jgi:hypothetical protein
MTTHKPPPPPPSKPPDQPKPQPTTASHGVGAVFPHVAGRCPACRGSSLFRGEAGHVTCSRLDCPDPCAADDLLHADRPELLVDPAAAQVLAAARAWWDSLSPDGREHLRHASADGALKALAAAMDALGDTTEAEHDRRMAAGEPVLVVGTPPPWRVEAAPPPTAGTPSEPAGRDHHWIEPEQAVGSTPPWRKEPVATANLAVASHGLAEVLMRLRVALDAGQDVPDADLVPLAGTHREALARAVRANEEQTAEAERLRAELARVRRELAEVQGRVEDYRRDAWDRTAAVDALRAELATARRDAELWERAAGDMEARDRHAAADTLDWAAGEWHRTAVGTNEWPTRDQLHQWATEIRAGTRSIGDVR